MLEGMSPFLGSAQVLNFGRKNCIFLILLWLHLQLSGDLYPIAQKAFWKELDSIFNVKEKA